MTLTSEWLRRFGWPETLLTGHPLAIAHRGACAYAPENTEKSFRIAADLCAEMWELDLRLSADGVCVVSHDDDLTRQAGRGVRISQTPWQALAALELPEGQRLMRLEQVIDLARACGCGLYIEIKDEGAGPEAWRILQEAQFRFAALASFVPEWIGALRDRGCDWPLAVLVPAGADPRAHAQAARPDIVHICWRKASGTPGRLLTDTLMHDLAGYQIILWDEDRPEVVEDILDKPVMGICSDRPEMLKPYRPDPEHPVEIVCHRGANNLAPENTLEAARICIDQRFDYVELDVRTTNDGALVVMHDPGLERTTSGTGLVIEQSLDHLRGLDAGGWFRDGMRGEKVPTFEEYLALARSRSAGLYVELKHTDGNRLIETVRRAGMLERCFFWSYDTDLLRWMRRQSPEIVLMATRWMYPSVAETVADYNAQIVEFDVTRDDLSEVAQCRDLGVRSMIFSTRADWEDLESYLQYRPDMVNLDYPERFKIVASYPEVRRHFRAMTRADEQGTANKNIPGHGP